ncbi:MAG TPA: dihydropteroate synthase [Gammaproteobacteria bacterium]|nr:dihydropteroate synthase [Gammaproteobacteria bacterium]
MGIVNVTPDSFSDGGRFDSHESAIAQGRRLVADGAHIVDVGGESTRPSAATVSVREEIERVIPVVSALSHDDIAVSIDTSKPEVMEAAVAAGARMVNDIYALRRPGALKMVARLNVPVCLMHMQGTPATMQKAPHYSDIGREIAEFLISRIDACLDAGIDKANLLIDPGFGFGKTRYHNHILMGGLSRFSELGVPLLIGVSRKAFVRALTQFDSLEALDQISALLALLAVEQGAKVVRVHNARVTRSILGKCSGLEPVSPQSVN